MYPDALLTDSLCAVWIGFVGFCGEHISITSDMPIGFLGYLQERNESILLLVIKRLMPGLEAWYIIN